MTSEDDHPDGGATAERSDGAVTTVTMEVVAVGRSVLRLADETHISFLAAALAYYGFVSMVPLVVLAVVVATTVGGEALADRLVAILEGLIAPAGQALLRDVLTERTGLGSVTVFSVAVLVWGALRSFRALDRAFSLVYGGPSPESVVESLADAIVALAAVGAAAWVVVLVGAAVALLPGRLPGGLGAVALLLTLVVILFPVYFFLPDADVSAAEVLPGTILAAVGWTVLGAVFELYAVYVSRVSVYGLLGTVLLALTWLYLGALVLLLGAAVNAVRSGHAPAADR
jgi:YihY family inner membrane protein